MYDWGGEEGRAGERGAEEEEEEEEEKGGGGGREGEEDLQSNALVA